MVDLGILSAGWVVVGIIILVIFMVIAIVQKRQSMATSVVKILSIFIVLSIGYIFIVNGIQINSVSSIIDGTKIYFNWLLSFFDRAADVTSYAVQQDWTANATTGK